MSMISIIKNPPTEAIVITCHAFQIALATTTKKEYNPKELYYLRCKLPNFLTRF